MRSEASKYKLLYNCVCDGYQIHCSMVSSELGELCWGISPRRDWRRDAPGALRG